MGPPWAYERITEGDEVCGANQDLHPEAVDLVGKIRRNSYYRPKVADPLTPNTFVHRIGVPSFVTCQWTAEQTGGHCPRLVRNFTGTDRAWFTFSNGTHPDSLDPAIFNRWFDFLELYVAKRKPQLDPGVRASAPVLYAALLGVPGVELPDDPIQAEPSYAAARAAFEAQRRGRILFENGAGGAPGKPHPAFERSFRDLPAPRTEARSLYLRDRGKLRRNPGPRAAEKFRWDPDARPPTNFTGDTGSGDLWTAKPSYRWSQPAPGRALS